MLPSGAKYKVEIVNPVGGSLTVGGPVADGEAYGSNKPVITGGVDGSGNAQTHLVDSSGRTNVVGAAASGGAIAGINPISVGVQDNTTNLVNLRANANNNDTLASNTFFGLVSCGLGYAFTGATNWERMRTATGAAGTPGTGLLGVGPLGFDGTNHQLLRVLQFSTDFSNGAGALQMGPYLYNGGSFDRQRNNIAATVLASAARTATTNSSDQTNHNAKGFTLFLDVSEIVATPSITLSLQIKDSISGLYFTFWTAALAVTAPGQFAYQFGPGASDNGSWTETSAFFVGRTWRVVSTHADADSITYSVSVQHHI